MSDASLSDEQERLLYGPDDCYMLSDTAWTLYVDGEVAAQVSMAGEASFDWHALMV